MELIFLYLSCTQLQLGFVLMKHMLPARILEENLAKHRTRDVCFLVQYSNRVHLVYVMCPGISFY